MRNPTDPSLNSLSNLNGTREKVNGKLATEAKKSLARAQIEQHKILNSLAILCNR